MMLNTLQLEKYWSHTVVMPDFDIESHCPAELLYAIQHNQLHLQYQPRYDTESGKSNLFEALVRWQHPSRGLLAPDTFIAIAEEHGLICKLGLWVFERCCKDLIRLRHQLKQKIKIAVNLSLLQCEDPQHASKIHDICQKYLLELSDFEFELTESEGIQNKTRVIRFCETLRELGAEISLDDFGTCYSPLNNLCELPVNYIKIDKSFTDNIGNGGRDEILISHLIKLAHEMDIKVVAEGVEHAYQRDQLITMGCDQLQGFYMCKPLDPLTISPDHINMYS